MNEIKPSKQTNNDFFKTGLIIKQIEAFENFMWFIFDEQHECDLPIPGSNF